MILTPDEYRAIPYVLSLEAIEREGEWVCRAEYEELPGCVAEDASVLRVLDKVEELRVSFIDQALEHDLPLPVPRPPLRA